MLDMIETFKTSFFGKNLTSNTGLGKQDTHYIPLTNKTFGTSGIAPTDLHSEKMQQASQAKNRIKSQERQD